MSVQTPHLENLNSASQRLNPGSEWGALIGEKEKLVQQTTNQVRALDAEINNPQSYKDFEDDLNALDQSETPAEVENFLKANPGLILKTQNQIAEFFTEEPDWQSEKEVYASMKFQLCAGFEKALILRLKGVSRKYGSEALKGFCEELNAFWLEKLKVIAGQDGKISLYELLPQKALAGISCSPEVEKLLGNNAFIVDFAKLSAEIKRLESELKDRPFDPDSENSLPLDTQGRLTAAYQKMVVFFLKNLAAKLVDEKGKAVKGSGRQFMTALNELALEMIGGRKLTRGQFQEAWKTALQTNYLVKGNQVVKQVYEENSDESSDVDELKDKFDTLLTEPDEKVDLVREEYRKQAAQREAYQREAFFNPCGLGMRQWGDVLSAILYGAEKLLYGVILVNFGLAGFSPEKLAKDPVLYATAGGIYLAGQHYGVFGKKKAEIEQDTKKNLKEKIEVIGLESKLGKWLRVCKILGEGTTEMLENPAIAKSRRITSDNILDKVKNSNGRVSVAMLEKVGIKPAKKLPVDDDGNLVLASFQAHSDDKIESTDPESSTLFEILKTCQLNKINLSEFFND